MGTETGIEWTEATWNPIRGCSRVSEGCRNCYAERQAGRFAHGAYLDLVRLTDHGPRWTGDIHFAEEHLTDPLRWRKPRRIFVNSMSDLFHEKVKDKWIDRIFAVIYAAHWHQFQVLTKRPLRMRDYCASARIDSIAVEALAQYRRYGRFAKDESLLSARDIAEDIQWPMPNVWMGTSVEDQATADERIPLLLQTPAAIRWVSYEPALELVNFHFPNPYEVAGGYRGSFPAKMLKVDWIVVGGESGPGARPFNIQWARDAIAQCKAAGVPVFCKQLGAYVISRNDTGFEGDTPHSWPMDTNIGESEGYQGAPLRVYLKDRKGGDWDEWPEDLRVREYPAMEKAAKA